MNNNIFPCLWYDGDAKKSADLYCQLFGGTITVDTPVVINIELFGQRLMLLNGGPQFQKNSSVSFHINCYTEEEVKKYWDVLIEGGFALMPLDTYPWSKKYAWVQDKFGVNWQLYYAETPQAQKLVPSLMFVQNNLGKAQKAMDFYTSIFPNSKIENVLNYDGTEDKKEYVKHANFSLDGYQFYCMDSSYNHQFNFNEAISMVVITKDQQETDYLWDHLISDGGKESRCGWLKDQFGFSWQIVPIQLMQLMNDPNNPEKGQKVVEAMLKMDKIIIADLEAAYNS